ncbi:MAG: efflux RND transporter periplasmic adaptor subunit [Planctomycetales bacterium]|nr:efflux RND transporter periplasmic adaptor subunit [Planctomycetales bacterium]
MMAKQDYSRVPLVLFALIVVGAGGWFGGVWFANRSAMENMPGMTSAKSMDMPGMSHESKTSGEMTSETMSGKGESTDADKETQSTHAAVMIDPALAKRLGVTVGIVESGPLNMNIQTVGIVQPDETRVNDVYLKTDGWVKDVFVDFTGKRIEKDSKLLSIYSPDFVSIQEEFISAREFASANRRSQLESSLQASALEKLRLLDIPEDEIQRLEQTGKPAKYLTLRSPLSGTVLEKNAFPGQRITSANMLYVVADLSKVWVQAKVYEYELTHVELGQPAIVHISAFPNEAFEGKVIFVQPSLDESSRTTDVRVELSNQDGRIKIGMFADVEIKHDMGTGLLVESAAVIRSGEKDIVFRVKGDKHYEPVAVHISPLKFGNRFQVLDGLAAGDKVVTSANFLLDSESRLRAGGGGAMPGMGGMDMGSGAKGDKEMIGHAH